MGKVLMSGASGGVKSDDVTASKWDVVQGKKTITTDSDDEVVEGTLPEIVSDCKADSTAMSQLNYFANIPKGAYRREDLGDSGGKIYVPLTTLRQDIGYTNPAKVLSDTTIAAQQGTIPFQNAETDGDRAWATSIVCSEGQANFGVRNGHYFNGVNRVRGNIPNFSAGNIKKGVNMGGLVGTFEGWVPTPQDLYYNGVNINNIIAINTAVARPENTRILIFSKSQSFSVGYFVRDIDVRSYSRLIFEGNFTQLYGNLVTFGLNGSGYLVYTTFDRTPLTKIEFDISQIITIPATIRIFFENFGANNNSYITRIRLT